jgi:peptidoglycan/xylan/chitin deacetylase (PgdA/CDA1 family)
MRLQTSTLALALVAGAAGPALAQTCTPTAITPYISIDGTWTRTDSAVVSAGKQVALGPQPISGGAWSWSGCGTGGTGREQTFAVSATCSATATYTNSCGAKSQQTFTLSVPVVARDVSVQEGLTAVAVRPSLALAAGRTASWSLAGTDAARFSIDAATGALTFRQAPNAASPADADGRNDYEVTLQVSDGLRSAQAPVTVRVLPWNQGGPAALPLPPAPREVARPGASTAQPGLRVLDWAGFKAAVSYTFDDSQPSQIEHYPELKAQRVRNTFYINPTANWYPQWNDPTRFDAVWQDAIAQGSEIGNHTTHHCRAAELTDNDASTCSAGLASAGAEFDDTNNYIRTKIGQSGVWTAAYPFGDTDYRAAAASRFFIGRGVQPGLVAPGAGSDALNLPLAGLASGGDRLATYNAAVDNALSQGRWMIYLFHTLLPTTQDWGGGEDIGVVTGNMAYAKSLGTVWIDSVVNIGAYWRGQQLLQGATPSTSGGVTTWRWTLPANFPPGRKLRVVVDGGTLSQNGTALPWSPRGYYEVSLDAQALSWTP